VAKFAYKPGTEPGVSRERPSDERGFDGHPRHGHREDMGGKKAQNVTAEIESGPLAGERPDDVAIYKACLNSEMETMTERAKRKLGTRVQGP